MFKQEIIFNKLEAKKFKKQIETDFSHKEYYKSTTVGVSKNKVASKGYSSRNSYNISFNFNENLTNILLPKLKKYNINSLPPYGQLLRYSEGHFFKPHRDNGVDEISHRFRTLIIQLSESNDYTGGKLSVWTPSGNKVISDSTIGNLILFNSNYLHEVSMLKTGIRYAMVMWLTHDNFNKTTTLI